MHGFVSKIMNFIDIFLRTVTSSLMVTLVHFLVIFELARKANILDLYTFANIASGLIKRILLSRCVFALSCGQRFMSINSAGKANIVFLKTTV